VLDVAGNFVQDHCFHGRGKMYDCCMESMFEYVSVSIW
jgi:hypothetical protein